MKIHNVRLGFATNSSSTHSVILLRSERGNADRDDEVAHGDFGWNFWTAASNAAKSRYLAHLICQNLGRQVGNDIAQVVGKAWAGIPQDVDLSEDNGIDHQSEVTLPRNWDGVGLDKEFVEDLAEFLAREDVVILGGNDNDDAKHELSKLGTPTNWSFLWKEVADHEIVAKMDGPHWVLFDRTTGNKLRFAFDPSAPAYTKAAAPELVDIKITDFCPYGCSYCYQDSTARGAHAEKSHLEGLAYVLSEMRVFEVALGGGEPTLHPNFIEVVKHFRYKGIVPNFTTRNMSFLRDPKAMDAIKNVVGAFALSVDEKTNGRRLDEVLDYARNGALGKKMTVQYVIGSSSQWFFRDLIEFATKNSIKLVLLGAKTNGRGLELANDEKTRQTRDWVKTVREVADYGYVRIGIDTALAEQSKHLLEEAEVPEVLYTVREGDFSMYIDAVTRRVGPSSYCDESAYRKLENGSAVELGLAFQSF